MIVLVAPHLWHTFGLIWNFYLSSLGKNQYCVLVLFLISLICNEINHLFMTISHCKINNVKFPFKPFAYFLSAFFPPNWFIYSEYEAFTGYVYYNFLPSGTHLFTGMIFVCINSQDWTLENAKLFRSYLSKALIN